MGWGVGVDKRWGGVNRLGKWKGAIDIDSIGHRCLTEPPFNPPHPVYFLDVPLSRISGEAVNNARSQSWVLSRACSLLSGMKVAGPFGKVKDIAERARDAVARRPILWCQRFHTAARAKGAAPCHVIA